MPGKEFSFLAGEVEVTVPDQKNGKKVKPKKVQKDSISKLKGKSGKFQPHRIVMNVVLVDDADKLMGSFDPPVELRFRYNASDLKEAEKAGKKLALAFWDEKAMDWVVFTKAKHQFNMVPDSNKKSGVAVVKISKWADPNVGWGRI